MAIGLNTSEVLETLYELMSRLSSDDREMWHRAIRRTLRTENPWQPYAPDFKTLCTLTVGNHKNSMIRLRNMGQKAGAIGADLACWAQPGETMYPKKGRIEVVALSVYELGFRQVTSREKIYEAAIAAGFKLCLVEIGVQLFIQYLDMPKGEKLHIGMEPLPYHGGHAILVVDNENGYRRCDHKCNPNTVFHPRQKWVFTR